MNPPEQATTTPRHTLTRRQALGRGAAVATTMVWAVPVVDRVLLHATAAEAASSPGGGGGTPPPPAPTGLPSHGFFLIKTGGKLYGFQIDPDKGSAVVIGSPGIGNDITWLQTTGGYAGQTIYTSGATWDSLKSQITASEAKYPGTTVTVLKLSAWPGVLQGAWTWDGSFQKDPDGDKVRPAVLTLGAYYFYK